MKLQAFQDNKGSPWPLRLRGSISSNLSRDRTTDAASAIHCRRRAAEALAELSGPSWIDSVRTGFVVWRHPSSVNINAHGPVVHVVRELETANISAFPDLRIYG